MFGFFSYLFKERTNQAYSGDHDMVYVDSGSSYHSRQPSVVNHNAVYSPNSVLSANNVSYDMYGNQGSKLATRYDHKSQSSASLYGSRVKQTEVKIKKKI